MCLCAGRSQKTLKSRCLGRRALCSPAGARQLAGKELPVCLGSLLPHPDQRLGPHPAGGPHPSNRTAPVTPLRPAGSLFFQPHAQPCLHSGRPCRDDTSSGHQPTGGQAGCPLPLSGRPTVCWSAALSRCQSAAPPSAAWHTLIHWADGTVRLKRMNE